MGAPLKERVERRDKVKFLRGDGDPRKALSRGPLAAVLACGLPFADQRPLLDFVEDVNGELRRRHTWALDGSATVTFRLPGGPETIEANEVIRRFNDDDWCIQNPHHPLAYMRAMFDKLRDIQDTLKAMPEYPFRKVPGRGTSFALIPANATPEEKAAILAAMEKSV